jgi:hypothetical protein
MRLMIPLLATLALCACRTETPKEETGFPGEDCVWYVDADGDGFGDGDQPATGPCDDPGSGFVADATDCDDADAAVHPDAEEWCNGLDDDCDGLVDAADDDAQGLGSWFADADGDGHGDPGSPVSACEQPVDTVESGDDCDDGNAEVFPGAPERCNGVDDDCDGSVDEALQEWWHADADGDGYGDPDATLESCDPGSGWVVDASDCDDGRASVHPGAEEQCDLLDNDCDGEIDEDLGTTWYADGDGDGHGDPDSAAVLCDPGPGWVAGATDCDDANSDINPDAPEVCNGYDDDCDGLIDDLDSDLVDGTTWYADADGDGYGDDGSTTTSCVQPAGSAAYGGDCDDGDAAYNPGASESDCTDPADYNCDGSTGYSDADGDGWAACSECDDGDAAVHPGASELCNGVDDDCDGDVDEDSAVDAAVWYEDSDGDGYGSLANTAVACDEPDGFTDDASDCDDGDASISPAGAEDCDGVDDDCDGDIDEGVTTTWYADLDGDGYGDPGNSAEACAQPSGYTHDTSDCDDDDATINPDGTELCDGADNDCDGLLDEADAVDAPTWYMDSDGDGYGNLAATTQACSPPSGYLADSDDCDDRAAAVNPDAAELCDGIDNDCDGDVDEDDATDASSWYLDADGDGFGDAASTVSACTQPSGTTTDTSDCDDSDAAINPAATELCNGADDDCDGTVDEDSAADAATWYYDMDGDGYGDAGGVAIACSEPAGFVGDSSDCDDGDAAVHPAAVEWCNSLDDDCDGLIDADDPDAVGLSLWYSDADGDGYGAGTPVEACSQPSGTSIDPFDCDDADADIHPLADEHCDGVDEDCDGVVDEASAVDAPTWYADADGDGYGDPYSVTVACSQPSGTVSHASDCDDGDAAVHPGAGEWCNGYDDDCDGYVDDDDTAVMDGDAYYQDFDLDGYGDPAVSVSACAEPSGYTDDATDCDDGDAAINPDASEACNGLDDDCDGFPDNGGVCPCDVHHYGTAPYMVCDSTATWADAQATCWAVDYHLLTIDDAVEDLWIDGLVDSYSTEKWWMGFNDIDSEGSWVWEDGTAVGYTNWAAGEPNDSGGEDCGQLNRYHPDTTWNDEPCTSSFRYVCEYY